MRDTFWRKRQLWPKNVFTQILKRLYDFCYRLSTIRSADKIVALTDGQVAEIGTHDELMNKEGLYHSLVMAQISKGKFIKIQLKFKIYWS